MHGGFGREQTWNNMAAIGPDFKKNFIDPFPVGNVDIVPTLAHILSIDMPSTGSLRGRVTSEALAGNDAGAHSGADAAKPEAKVQISSPAANGFRTILEYQEAHGVRYLDRACFVQNLKHCE